MKLPHKSSEAASNSDPSCQMLVGTSASHRAENSCETDLQLSLGCNSTCFKSLKSVRSQEYADVPVSISTMSCR